MSRSGSPSGSRWARRSAPASSRGRARIGEPLLHRLRDRWRLSAAIVRGLVDAGLGVALQRGGRRRLAGLVAKLAGDAVALADEGAPAEPGSKRDEYDEQESHDRPSDVRGLKSKAAPEGALLDGAEDGIDLRGRQPRAHSDCFLAPEEAALDPDRLQPHLLAVAGAELGADIAQAVDEAGLLGLRSAPD